MFSLKFVARFAAAIVLFSSVAAFAEGDPVSGEQQFGRKCGSCHSVIPGEVRLGPSLSGVVGRQSGTVLGFSYSASYVDAGNRGLVWRPSELDAFITNPVIFLGRLLQQQNPGTRMTLRISDQQARADIVAYLATLTGSPTLTPALRLQGK